MRIGSIEITPLSAMLVFIPICVVLELMHADPAWIFITAGLAIIPLAGLMGTATEHLAEHYGAGIGGLLNAILGRAQRACCAEVAEAMGSGQGGAADLEARFVAMFRAEWRAQRGDAPLLPSERLWGFWEFTYANSALAIATWAFLIGGAVGLFVGPINTSTGLTDRRFNG